MSQDPCLVPNFNPSRVHIDLDILTLFDERDHCPLYWDKDAEFVIDPRVIMDMYLLNGQDFPAGLTWKLSKLSGQTVLFKRDEAWAKCNMKVASAPGYFTMFVENENGDWVTPYPDYQPHVFNCTA